MKKSLIRNNETNNIFNTGKIVLLLLKRTSKVTEISQDLVLKT